VSTQDAPISVLTSLELWNEAHTRYAETSCVPRISAGSVRAPAAFWLNTAANVSTEGESRSRVILIQPFSRAIRDYNLFLSLEAILPLPLYFNVSEMEVQIEK